MAINYTQTDSAIIAGIYCSGGASSANDIARTAVDGGTAGTGTPSVIATASGVSEALLNFEITPAGGTSWDAGTWTVRLNVTTANMNVTLVAIWICRVDSSGVNQATIGSATGLSISVGTTGVKSQTVTGSAQTPAAGDMVEVVFLFSNGAMSSSSLNIKPDQNIDSPFTAGAADTLFAQSVM